ncbi:carbohydrate kinase family protein [Micromonospora sp. NBC_01796]|uniref:carbohydrate kinase family protein n=1 Tax=Micromonospora sp. NBC_01796 TaxID=2975987 RepID=UPI002DD9BC70|nr:carbohydrate kinase [Micromonospora sp. NBC_01796]WSA85991.1 carbohydrate kinase [Micromonospora sp. NBC_01796]
MRTAREQGDGSVSPDPTPVTVLGEAVVDLVPEPDGRYAAHPGGSPLNVAVGLARLGVPTRLLARFSTTALGRRLRGHAAANGVDLRYAVDAEEPATLAIVSLGADGNAGYDFYVEGTADWAWRPGELDVALARRGIVHAGSLAVFLPPGADRVGAALRAARDNGMIVSLDPNVRPGLLGTPAEAHTRVDELVRHAHVVKASEEDIGWLYPGRSQEQVLDHWHDRGVTLGVVTLGPRGAVARSGNRLLRQAAPAVEVVDTIGAGDAFTAGLLAVLSRSGAGPAWSDDEIGAALRYAVAVAAATCARPGADPPHRDELPGPPTDSSGRAPDGTYR